MTDMVDRATERSTIWSTIAGLARYRELLKNLVLKDLKLKYRGSVLGFLWSLLNPLIMMGVYTVAFKYILGSKVEGFVFFLLLGILPWGFFVGSTTMATRSITDSDDLMKSVRFPSAVLPVATVLFNLAQYLLTIVVFLPLMLVAYGVPLAAPMLLYPVFLMLQVLFTIGVALVLAAGTVFFLDVRHLLEVALPILFWVTPIVYPLSQVPGQWRPLILLSPLSPYIGAYQQIFYYHQWPSAEMWLVGTVYGCGALLVGMRFFLAVENRLSEQL
ncbi:MAG: ABC transporter permease [Acidobacteria bacterium]|nr:ABC transporter permease [Acidobacteriota bacterium]